ncbi:hypothetical protein D1007_04684 [Hordeum vulgare]|nr:hypothetical protein D1007_04684 [Hordeum vulgare]
MPSSKKSPGARGPWSDGETSALVDAWGPMYLRRNQNPLAVEEWRVVCSAVNAQRAAEGCRFNRSLVQCQKRIYTLKDQYQKELAKGRPTSGWRHFTQLRAFLADSPPGFATKTTAASGKKEKEEEVEEASPCFRETKPVTVKNEEVVGCGCELVGSVRCCPAATVTKLAEVYERVEMKRLGVKEKEMEMEKNTISRCILGHKKMKVENPEETHGN